MSLLWKQLGSLAHSLANIASKKHSLESRFRIRERLQGPWPTGPFLWLHGASLGECKMLLGLANALQTDLPHCPPVLITTQKAEVLPQLSNNPKIAAAMAPADTPRAMATFMEQVQPTALILGENELWPGYLSTMHKAGKPIALVSGRYRNSYPGAELSAISFASMQSREDLARLKSSGYASSPSLVGGDWKLLPWARQSETQISFPSTAERPIDCVFISIHQEEWNSIKPLLQDASERQQTIVLMPRRLEETNLFQQQISEMGLSTLDWPQIKAGSITLVRQFGLGKKILSMSRTAIVGGSFSKKLGIHDFWEPIQLGTTTCIGPFAKGKEDMVRPLLNARIIQQVHSTNDFRQILPPDSSLVNNYLAQERQKILDSYRQLTSFFY